MQFHYFVHAKGLYTYENHHTCIFMNINHTCIFMNINLTCVIGNQQYKKNGCLLTKMLTSEQSIVLKMTEIETTVMHGYRAVFLVVNNANIH